MDNPKNSFDIVDEVIVQIRLCCKGIWMQIDGKLDEEKVRHGKIVCNSASSILKYWILGNQKKILSDILSRYGDGTYLYLLSKALYTVEIVLAFSSTTNKTKNVRKKTLRKLLRDLRIFERYMHFVRERVREELPESTKKSYQIRLVIETGDVFLGDELRCKLEPGSPEYCWFSHLLEEPSYTTFSDAKKIHPTALESAVVTRLNNSLKDKIASNVVEVAENLVSGTRLNPIYERV